MPKTVAFTPYQRPGRSGWWINVPAKLSDTGKRQRLSFETKTLAKADAQRRSRNLQMAGQSAVLKADVAAGAMEALAILKPYGASLVEAAREYAAKRDQQAKSVSFLEAFDRYVARPKKRPSSDAYKRNQAFVRSKIPENVASVLVCDLDKNQIERALRAVGPTDESFALGYRIVRAVLNWSVKQRWAEENELLRIDCDSPGKAEVASIVTLGQAQAVMSSCRDLRGEEDGLDCSDCGPAFSIMLFAGLRPEELARLEWSDIDLESRNIRVPAAKSKTNTLRNVHIEDNLLAWLSPQSGSIGQVKPRNWKRKATLVRKVAGIGGEHDILRHSYGSYWLAAHGDVSALQSYMGHAHVTTYFDHYHHAVRKREALKFWGIAPTVGNSLNGTLKRVAA